MPTALWTCLKRACTPAALAGAVALGSAAAAQALVVDTGPGDVYGGGWSLYDDRPATAGFQHLAARFTVDEADVVTSVQGWMNWNGGQLVFSVLSDFQGLPGATLHSATGQLAATVINQPDWRGIGSLQWALTAGHYWLVFEDSRGPGSGSMPPGAPMPLAGYASSPSVVPGQPWMLANTLNFGVRINTTPEPPPPIPIPEPATAWLWAVGASALLLRRVVGGGAQVTSMRKLGPRS